MKIIFLDFDGVLNSDKYVKECGRFGVIIDPEKLALLKRLVYKTDAKIVLSTSWREHWSPISEQCDETGALINSIFREHGLEIYDKTPQLSFKREEEIKRWLEDFGDVESFVVLDDLSLDTTGFLRDHFVKTSAYKRALTEEDVARAIEILTGERK